MSKKLAEDIDGLVLDIKTGSGAFMKRRRDAVLLAESLMNTAKSFGKKVISFITDMNQPLGNNIGNWLEVEEVIRVLQGEYVKNLSELSTLAGRRHDLPWRESRFNRRREKLNQRKL